MSSDFRDEMLTMILPKGPLVGHREPSSNITTEYASADPVYQAKTTVCHDPALRLPCYDAVTDRMTL